MGMLPDATAQHHYPGLAATLTGASMIVTALPITVLGSSVLPPILITPNHEAAKFARALLIGTTMAVSSCVVRDDFAVATTKSVMLCISDD